jgi:hypothetical protein
MSNLVSRNLKGLICCLGTPFDLGARDKVYHPPPPPFPSFSAARGVTTMGSDRENPGAPNPNGGPQAQAIARFWPSEFCKISPQCQGNGISESLDSKIFRVSMPWTPRKLVHIRRTTCAFGTSTGGGGIEKFELGAPWCNVTPLSAVLPLMPDSNH